MYQEVLRLDPMNIGAQNDLGVAYQARGKRTEAEAAYRRAAALAPFSFTAHLNLALLLRATNRAAEASQEFYLARQNARGKAETQLAEAASSGGKVEPMLSQA
jgi:Flp pilus assembly protein TadD